MAIVKYVKQKNYTLSMTTELYTFINIAYRQTVPENVAKRASWIRT